MRYDKPALTISDQISLLEERGLIIDSRRDAEHFLNHISYYRLAGYWWNLQEDLTTHRFTGGTTFSEVIDRYNFDRELRLLCFNMIERIEIALRTQLVYRLSVGHGAYWFEDPGLFRNSRRWSHHINDLQRELRRSREVFIQEHYRKYDTDDRNPPAWKSLEVVSLGLLSKFYENLSNQLTEKDDIARHLGVFNHRYLTNWLKSITVIRNICAHHSRLWNRNLPTPPRMLRRTSLRWIDNHSTIDPHSLYACLVCMQYLLQTISPNNRFPQRLHDLFDRHPGMQPSEIGADDDWQTQPVWQFNP